VYDYMLMATSRRHNFITGSLFANVFELFKKNMINPFQEEVALVYEGERKKNGPFRLVDVRLVQDPEKFSEGVINDYEYVQPDFAFFKKNPYLTNRRETRTAGKPDLIVEVWSESNSAEEREWKFNLYSTSDETEHWYVDQDSNMVKCYFGRNKLPDQCLTRILRTQDGIEFDLRHLALPGL